MDEEIIVEEVIIVDEHSVDDEAAKASVQEYQDAIATNDPAAPTGEEPVTDVDGTEVTQTDMPASGVWPGQPADALDEKNLAATPEDVTEGVQGADGGVPAAPVAPEPVATESEPAATPEPVWPEPVVPAADPLVGVGEQVTTTPAPEPAAEPVAPVPGAELPTPPEPPQEPTTATP